MRGRPWLGAAVAAAAVAVAAYPYAMSWVVDRLGVRVAAVAALAAIAATLPLRRRLAPRLWVPGTLAFALLAGGAAWTGRVVCFQLVPAVVYAGLAAYCASSLRGPDSIVERVARLLVPEAPPFIRSYCRTVTALWAVLFAAISVAIAWLAASGHPAWRSASGLWLYAAMGAVSFVEFLVRKTWFRYYWHGNPFDRFWSWLFPADRTERGRRSMAYIAQIRASRG